MKRYILKFIVPVFIHQLIGFSLFAQVTGDFQSRNASGNWSDFNAWNRYNGTAWVAAVSGQVPSANSSVYIQSGQVIAVDESNAVCNDLRITNTSGGSISFPNANGVLNIKGNMYITNTANCFSTWTSGAKIVFSGTGNQSLPNNLGTNSVLDHLEVNKASGTLTSGNSFRFNRFTITAGNFLVASGADARGNSATATIEINGGSWTQTQSTTKIYDRSNGQTAPIGLVTINGGSMHLATSNTAGGFRFSAIQVINGGTLTLNNFNGNFSIGSSIEVDNNSTFNVALDNIALPPSVTFNGKVNYNQSGPQTIAPATYDYLQISGSGSKTLGTGTITIPASGTLEMSGSGPVPTLIAGGSLSVSTNGSNLIYSGSAAQTAGTTDWNINFQNITINNPAGVSMGSLNRTITGTLQLENGVLNIGTGGSLTLDGGELTRTTGYLSGTSTSDLTITGNTGGEVLLPMSTNISLRNITVSGNRTLILDGAHNISLNGTLLIDAGATFDNGGESQITNGGGGIVSVYGTWINRDQDNFTGTGGCIPGIDPSLYPGSTIDFGRSGDQLVSNQSDYSNLTFSGSGVKTLASAIVPNGTVTITDNAVVDASGHNLGDGTTGWTDFIMDGGRLILGTTGTQPMMNGTYTLTGGVIQFDGPNNQTIRPESYQNVEVTGAGVGNSNGNITLNTNGTFTVRNGGVFTINDNTITGGDATQAVTVENGGTFRCGNNQGFNGFNATLYDNSSVHANITDITLEAGSTVEYMRTGDQPITNTGDLVYQNLALSGSGNKTAPAATLTVQGDLNSNASVNFVHNEGTVLLNGSGDQSFAGINYNNLVLDNAIKSTLGNCTISDSLKINPGTELSIGPSHLITLHSDHTKTARVARMEGTINYNGTGRFIAERYIPARKAWRFLAVPLNSSQTIKQAWQENATNTSQDPNPGYGTQVTSDRSSWNADGFDAYSSGGPSMKIFDPVTETYQGISSTNVNFDPSAGGYMTFIRGDRSANTFSSPVSPTVLRMAGTLFTGDQSPVTIPSGEIIPLNNPYASAIDLRSISQSGQLFFYVWDPNRGGDYGYGGWLTLFWNGSHYEPVLPGGSYGTTADYIESGQAFLASTLGVTTSVTLREENKCSGDFSAIPFTAGGLDKIKLRTNLYGVGPSGARMLLDGTIQLFDKGYDNSVNGNDGLKFNTTSPEVSIQTGNTLLVVERRSLPASNDTVRLRVSNLSTGKYEWEIIASDLRQSGLEAKLIDNWLATERSFQLNDTNQIGFEVSADPGSRNPGRFEIVFTAPAGPLPVHFMDMKGYLNDEKVTLEWKVENESMAETYEVESSDNGTDFIRLSVMDADRLAGGQYTYMDSRPLFGDRFYRVKTIGDRDNPVYSRIIKITDNQPGKIAIYPNPVKNGSVQLHLDSRQAGNYRIRILNQSGQVILERSLIHASQTSWVQIRLPGSVVGKGGFYLELTKPDDTKKILKFINLN